jgi:glycosyltransferase involved in cell wall biosynthesis
MFTDLENTNTSDRIRSAVKVAYLTTYYNGAVDGRFGRFHDWVHTLRDMPDPPFEFDIVALTASNPDGTLSSPPHAVLGEATEMWGSPYNDVEFALDVPRAIRDLQRMEFDVLHVVRLDAKGYPVALAFADRSPVVGPNLQGYVPGREGSRWNKGGLGRLRNAYEFYRNQALFRLAVDPTAVALSQYHARNIRAYGSGGVVEVVPPGVASCFRPRDEMDAPNDDRSMDGDPSSLEDRPTRFLYVGDFSAYKGYDLFLDSLAGLPDDLRFTATVVGSGDPRRDRIAALRLDDVVSVEGFVQRSELPEYYREADFYVMPSIDENGPNTIVEALACGTPVIATDKPGINEYAPEDASIYVDRTGADLRRAFLVAHEDREQYARAARETADEFSAECTVGALADLYERHVARTSE